MFQKTANGNLLRLTAGSLVKECCCGGTSPSSCFGGQPEIILTVTGTATTTVKWCDKTWNMPADSGLAQTVCPDDYYNGKYSISNFQQWKFLAITGNPDITTFSGSARMGLQLERVFKPAGSYAWNKVGFEAAYFGNMKVDKYWKSGIVTASQNGLGSFSSILGQFNNPPRTALLAVGQPTISGYQIPTSESSPFFGSFTSASGTVYTWAKGNGW